MNNKKLRTIFVATITCFASITASLAGDLSNIVPRVLALESAIPQAADYDYSGYTMPFSASGEPRNVIILREIKSGGSVNYSVRVRHSSGETISVNGTPTLRTHIAHWGTAGASSVGSTEATYASDYIESPETTSYRNYLVESSSIDINNNNQKTVERDDQRYISKVSYGTNGLYFRQTKLEINGVLENETTFISQYLGKFTSTTFGNISYSDVSLEKSFNNSFPFARFRAKGIGEIYRESLSFGKKTAIYYRVNGQTGGSLIGTPFQPGVGNLDGLFFAP